MDLIEDGNKLYYTQYRVSTITCNANIGDNINLDLEILYNNFKIEDINSNGNFIWINYLRDNNEYFRGVYPKKKRKSKKIPIKKTRFDNQITTIYKVNDIYMPNVKIFKNGNIQLTGIKRIEDTEVIVNKIIEDIKNIYIITNKIIIANIIDDSIMDTLKYKNFKIRMINSDFKIYTNKENTIKFNIRRRELHNILINDIYNNKCSFQPGIYQGVKLEYYWNLENKENNGICRCTKNCFGKNTGEGDGNCKKVTIAIFESGSILITGGITFIQVEDAYNYIIKVIEENKKRIRKPLFNEIINGHL